MSAPPPRTDAHPLRTFPGRLFLVSSALLVLLYLLLQCPCLGRRRGRCGRLDALAIGACHADRTQLLPGQHGHDHSDRGKQVPELAARTAALPVFCCVRIAIQAQALERCLVQCHAYSLVWESGAI